MEQTISMQLGKKVLFDIYNGPMVIQLEIKPRIYLRNNHLQYAITWFNFYWVDRSVLFCKHKKKIMNYSSRGKDNDISFVDAMLNGLAKDNLAFTFQKFRNFPKKN